MRTEPMMPREFREAMKRVCYGDSDSVSATFELSWWRYQYIAADRDKQLATSVELDKDLSELVAPNRADGDLSSITP